MGRDSMLAVSLDAAVEKLVKEAKATEFVLRRNTPDGVFAGGDRDMVDPGFVAYHRLWMIVPACAAAIGSAHLEIGNPIIVVVMLAEFRAVKPTKGRKIEVGYKWISEDNGPAVIDPILLEWYDRVPAPPAIFGGVRASEKWRRMVRRVYTPRAPRAPRLRSKRSERTALMRAEQEHDCSKCGSRRGQVCVSPATGRPSRYPHGCRRAHSAAMGAGR